MIRQLIKKAGIFLDYT